MAFREHQVYAREWLRTRPKAILAMQQRTGKSPVAALDLIPPANILCPSFLKGRWLRELEQWRPELRGTILRPGESAKKKGGDVFITNFEILQDTNIATLPHLIVDEGHYCTSYEAKRTITTLALAQQADRVRWLTGTVMPNRSMELWPAMFAVGAVTTDAITFGCRYAGGWQDRWNDWHFRENTNTPELKAKLKPYLLRITREQIGMDEPDWNVIALDLPVDIRERDYSLDAIAASRDPFSIDGLAELLHLQGVSKVPMIVDYTHNILQDEGPLILFCWHRDVIEQCAMMIRQRGHSVDVIHGDVSHAMRDKIVDQFQAGTIDVLVANRKSAGVGLPLHRAERVIFGEGAWNHADQEQAADRSVSMDKARAVPVDILTVYGSIDERMVRRCLEKQGVIDSIIEPDQEFSTWQQKRALQRDRLPNRLSELRLPRPPSLSRP